MIRNLNTGRPSAVNAEVLKYFIGYMYSVTKKLPKKYLLDDIDKYEEVAVVRITGNTMDINITLEV